MITQTNTLVRHKQLRSVGIGCVSKILKNKVKVNFGTDDVMTCSLKMLIPVDTSKCKTITFNQFRMSQKFDYVIIGNELKHNVGVGYIHERVVTEEDLKKYPRVIE